MSVWHFAYRTLANRSPRVRAGHVGRSTKFIQKNKLIRLYLSELLEPLIACLLHVRAVLLRGVQRLFFRGSPSFPHARQSVGTLTLFPNFSASSFK